MDNQRMLLEVPVTEMMPVEHTVAVSKVAMTTTCIHIPVELFNLLRGAAYAVARDEGGRPSVSKLITQVVEEASERLEAMASASRRTAVSLNTHGVAVTDCQQRLATATNNSSKPVKVKALDKHRDALRSGNPRAIAVKKAVEAAGSYISDGGQNSFRCMWALYRAVVIEEVLGMHGLLERVIRTIMQTWPANEKAKRSEFVIGLTEFYATYGDVVRDADVIEKMSTVSPAKVLQDIATQKLDKSSGSADPAALVFCDIYNLRRKKRLDVGRLEKMHRLLEGIQTA